MTHLITDMHEILEIIANISVFMLELFGTCVLVYTAVKGFYYWIRKNESVRLYLAQGIALSLTFKMGGEVLRTIIARTWSELGVLGAIIVLRGLLTFLINWEIKEEKKALRDN
ncbi:DUF1622 domain-containing protein [Kandleria vitulina]|uniref:DUF1622 domain-containing protein n=1 Tax=Kandleria vitulina TaxID=1630 RepID=UPI00048E36C1|nr:DUF1622 domain-containing protein [Kandleria vitulina]